VRHRETASWLVAHTDSWRTAFQRQDIDDSDASSESVGALMVHNREVMEYHNEKKA
jgi:hypothetical protein